MKKSSVLFLLAACMFSTAAFAGKGEAQKARSNGYYKVSAVSVREVIPTPAELYSEFVAPAKPLPVPDYQTFDITPGDLQLIGEKIVEIIKAGKPVVDIKRDAVAAVPSGLTTWQQLAGWQVPATKVFTLDIKNDYDVAVVSLRLKVSAMYGGNLDGRGKYLANVIVVPSKVEVLWGWNLDLWTENRQPVNAGSVEDPVAGLGFDIRYRTTTWLEESDGAQDYYVTGEGQIIELQ